MADHVIPIEAPARSQRLGGIRTVAEFQTASRLGIGGELEFVSPGCDFPVDDIVLCYPAGGDPQAEKTNTGIDTLNGIVSPFGLYAGVQCYLGGGDFEAQARSLLEQGADRGIEKRLNDYFQTLTGVAAADFTEALASAEDYADVNYLGRPIIWVNRGDAIRAGKLKNDQASGEMYTANGTPVVSSGQVTAGTLAVTGSVAVHQTEILVSRAPQVTVNREMAIAEQIIAVALDCEFARLYEIG